MKLSVFFFFLFLILERGSDQELLFLQPYYQPNPTAPTPFNLNTAFNDPTFYGGSPSAWALAVKNSHNILIFGDYILPFGLDRIGILNMNHSVYRCWIIQLL